MKIIKLVRGRIDLFKYSVLKLLYAQFGHQTFIVRCCGTFTPDAWTGPCSPPLVTGQYTPDKGIRPNRVAVTEDLTVVFRGKDGTNYTRRVQTESATDGALVTAIVGDKYVLKLPMTAGYHLPRFESTFPSLGALGVDGAARWPAIQAGQEVRVVCSVMKSVLDRVTPPKGFELISVQIDLRFHFFGPEVQDVYI